METSPPYHRTACQGPPSELDKVLNPRSWILQMGKLSHCWGDDVPSATHPSSGASTSPPGHWTPKAAIRPLMVCPEPSLNYFGVQTQEEGSDTVPYTAQANHLWIQAQHHRSCTLVLLSWGLPVLPWQCWPPTGSVLLPRRAQGGGTKGFCVVSDGQLP